MEKWQKTYESWKVVNKQLYDDCKTYIIDCLNKLPEHTLEIDNDNQPVITTSGNHPEYDGNPFDCVSSLYIKNNKLVADTENWSGYDLDCINADEMSDLAYAVQTEMESIDIEELS